MELEGTVLYNGASRPYLKNRTGTILAFNAEKNSALVRFEPGNNYESQDAWVGVAALENAPEDTSPEAVIRKELEQIKKDWPEVRDAYRKMNTRKAQLEQALNAFGASYR